MSEVPRRCGPCDLCCTVLRVDALKKPGGRPCRHQRPGTGGCGIYADRPGICRDYRCLWLQGGLGDLDRPDRLGAVVDLATGEGLPYLAIRQWHEGAFEASPRLQAIAERFRETLPVRVTRAVDALDRDRPYRVLLADGVEHRVEGGRVAVWRDGRLVSEGAIPWLERQFRRWTLAWQAWWLRRRF